MKIFFPISAFYPSQIGGPCNTVYWHASALHKNGFGTSVVTTMAGIGKDAHIREDVFTESACGRVYYGSGGSGNLQTYKVLVKEIGKHDLLHLNSLFSFHSIAAFFYARVFYPSKPIVWSVRGELNKNALIYSKTKKKLFLSAYRKLGRNVVFHSTSESESADIDRVFPAFRQIRIPNYILPHPRLDAPVKKQILYIGRIHPIKGLAKLIEALSVSKLFKSSGYTLVLAGKHEERYAYYLQELKDDVVKYGLSDNVYFAGHVEGLEKEQYYAASYCAVLPSETENFGNVVVEALNQGTPVIASTGTPWQMLEAYHCGRHVSNEPASLAAAIDDMLAMPADDYAKMRENAKMLVDEAFNVETQISKWINQYEQIHHAKK